MICCEPTRTRCLRASRFQADAAQDHFPLAKEGAIGSSRVFMLPTSWPTYDHLAGSQYHCTRKRLNWQALSGRLQKFLVRLMFGSIAPAGSAAPAVRARICRSGPSVWADADLIAIVRIAEAAFIPGGPCVDVLPHALDGSYHLWGSERDLLQNRRSWPAAFDGPAGQAAANWSAHLEDQRAEPHGTGARPGRLSGLVGVSS